MKTSTGKTVRLKIELERIKRGINPQGQRNPQEIKSNLWQAALCDN